MQILSLTVRNIKLLADQTFSFADGKKQPRRWTMLLGENGLCKTTLLQCIALLTSGDRLARALVGDAREYVHVTGGEQPASMEATLRVDGKVRVVRLEIRPKSHDFVGAGPFDGALLTARAERRPGLFVVGYGVGRYLPRRGEVAVPQDPFKDRVEGVFDAHHKMLGTEFFEALKERKLHLAYAKALRDVLVARSKDGSRLLPMLESVDLSGQNGVDALTKLLESRRFTVSPSGGSSLKLPAHLLSQGYQSMIAWVADLLGHAFLETGKVSASSLEGIVLLDEIDLHLHPTWQRELVPLLRQVFPKLQFIATTHSPLVVAGCDAHEILELRHGPAGIVHTVSKDEPGLRTGSELLSRFFRVDRAARPELVAEHRELLRLRAVPKPTPRQRSRITELLGKLEPYAVREPEAS